MKEITVKYLLNEVEYKRLEKIAAVYKDKGLDFTPEKTFEMIMIAGSGYDIDGKLKYHEEILDIRQN